ncbi:MAG: tetratricopeptide repeat protein [Phycisphaerae bacterium]
MRRHAHVEPWAWHPAIKGPEIGSANEIDSRVHCLIDWLVAAVLQLLDHKIGPGLVQNIVDGSREHGEKQHVLGSKMTMTGLGTKAHWAWDEGRLDEAETLFERLISLVKPDDPHDHLEVAGMVRVLFDKGDQAVAFDLLGRSAMTAMDDQVLLVREAFGMIEMAKFRDVGESVNCTVFLEAIGQYECRHLAEKKLGLVDLWRRDPRRVLVILLDHSPQPPSILGPWRAKRDQF